jgi:hypothetical protein
MSINSINQTSVDNIQNTVSVSSAVQSESSSANKNSLYSNQVSNTAQDSININSSAISQSNFESANSIANHQTTFSNTVHVRAAMNSVLSYLRSGDIHFFNTLKSPSTKTVFNLILESGS